MSRDLEFPSLFQTAPHVCPYLPDASATNLIIDPNFTVDIDLYSKLLMNGFRRNGQLFYRPYCKSCRACESVRLPVLQFAPSRSQKRTLRRNNDVNISITEPVFSTEHFELYQKYQALRHTGDSMDDPDPEKYIRFLVDSNVESYFMEFRLNETLIGVSIMDRINNGISAVYSFFDPLLNKRSLGTFSILKQLDYAKQENLSFVYLGYWIESCNKMSYKTNFKPLEHFDTTNPSWTLRANDEETT